MRTGRKVPGPHTGQPFISRTLWPDAGWRRVRQPLLLPGQYRECPPRQWRVDAGTQVGPCRHEQRSGRREMTVLPAQTMTAIGGSVEAVWMMPSTELLQWPRELLRVSTPHRTQDRSPCQRSFSDPGRDRALRRLTAAVAEPLNVNGRCGIHAFVLDPSCDIDVSGRYGSDCARRLETMSGGPAATDHRACAAASAFLQRAGFGRHRTRW